MYKIINLFFLTGCPNWMRTKRPPVAVAMLLILLTFSGYLKADEGPEQSQREPQSDTESSKPQEKGPVYSPLKVKPYTKRLYKV